MTWDHDPPPGARRGYHHGNLREALITAALDLIAEKGPAGFTFAEAARAAGVSPAAPYRHFRDRDALMADVARRGFERFERGLKQAWDERQADAARGVRARRPRLSGLRARRAGAISRRCSRPGCRSPTFRDLQQGGRPRLRRAARCLRGVGRDDAEGKRPPVMMMALHIWALAHGIASHCLRAATQRAGRSR